jgi:signal peptidase I
MQITNNLKKWAKNNWGIVLFVLLMFASRSSLADWYLVPTGSMQPTIVEGDRIFVDKMAYRLEVPFTDISLKQLGQPKRGDIVVFNSKKAGNRLVKRLIGEPGDWIEMQDNQLIINGKTVTYSQDEEHKVRQTEQLPGFSHLVQFTPVANARDNFEPILIPTGFYLVLGDNRNNSADSRFYGLVPEVEIQGKAKKVLISLDPDNYYLPRSKRTLTDLI